MEPSFQKRLHPLVSEIAEVFDFGQLGGYFFVSMEYIAGQDLAAVMARGRAPEKRAADIVVQLCRILQKIERAALHIRDRSGSVIHGDIKPENIRLQNEDRVRLLDFGVAKHLSYSKKFTRQVFGSTPYISPEGLQHGVIDRNSDLWSVGIILYQLLAGKLPFPGETVEAVERRILSGNPPVPLPSGCSRDIERVAQKALAFSSSDRYATVAAFRSDLEAVLSGRPVAAEPWRVGWRPSHSTKPTQESPDGVSRNPPKLMFLAKGRGGRSKCPLGSFWFRVNDLGSVEENYALHNCFPGTDMGGHRLASDCGIEGELNSSLTGDEVAAAARRFKVLKDTSFFHSGFGDVQEKLRWSIQQTTGRITELPGGDMARVTEEEWASTRDLLKSSIDISGNDPRVRSRLLLSKANESRFRIQRLLASGQVDDASRLFQESARDLDESARLEPSWFAPYLAKAWLFEEAPASLGWSPESGFRNAIRAATERGYKVEAPEQARLYREDLETSRGLVLRAATLERESDGIRLLLEAEKLLAEDIQQMTSDSGAKPPLSMFLPFTQELDVVRSALRERGFGGTWNLGTAEPTPGSP